MDTYIRILLGFQTLIIPNPHQSQSVHQPELIVFISLSYLCHIKHLNMATQELQQQSGKCLYARHFNLIHVDGPAHHAYRVVLGD